ncbi:MAG: T9SS type A sorting domain-containing protein [Bacteroidetes bacterium]|nr:T9SS type A sorting domain-containing protein [Bacteroidota bacterium]
MTLSGGGGNSGVIFKIKPDGTGYVKLLDFTGTTNGSTPFGSLISDGIFLYGMTSAGGTYGKGVIFKIKSDGTGYAKLTDFTGANGDGPDGSLVSDGTFLYGMTNRGGTGTCAYYGCGVIFKIKHDGTGDTVLLNFKNTMYGPGSSLLSDGTFLYGMTYYGGVYGQGTIFKMKPDGTGYANLHCFPDTTLANGITPYGSLISDGTFLYGMTSAGGTGTNPSGTIFNIKPDGTSYSKLCNFAGTTNGSTPNSSLISDGTFLYGMTSAGGTGTACTDGCGTIFKIKPDGTGYSKLLDFFGFNGSYPKGSLISDGTFLYGMTVRGGAVNYGVIFKIKPDGTGYSNLHDFDYVSGQNPAGSLISDGIYLYGMTGGGGTGTYPSGTIFKIKPDGTSFAKIFDFQGVGDGGQPQGSLIFDGTFLYGMTSQGGIIGTTGTIFKIKPNGTGYVKLFDFTPANGTSPIGSLISDGTFLYGMTLYGGTGTCAYYGCGVIFKIKYDGTGYVKLLDFSGSANGIYPHGSLLSDGTFLYGMTSFGGVYNQGTIFKYNLLCTSVTNSFTITSPTCGNNNGSVTATTGGGTSPYTYSWSNGNTTATVTGLTGSLADTIIVTITDANNCTLIDTAIVQCATGIENYDLQNRFIIYPNPNNGTFAIETKEKKYELVIANVLGEKIYSSKINLGKSEIDLSNQPNGIYFMQIKTDQGTANKKLIINK